MLQRWSPFTDIDRVWDEMDRSAWRVLPASPTVPAAWDTLQAGDGLCTSRAMRSIFKAVIPGARSEDIELSVEQNTLTIRGRFGYALNTDDAQKTTWYRREIGAGQFAESVTLPVPVDSDKAEARFEDGILTLRLPKAEQARTRRIPVKQAHVLEEGSSN